MPNKFESLGLDQRIIKNLNDLEYKEMTPIQAKSLPLIIEGKDVIAQAKTGSGKTAAFGLGVLSNLDHQTFRPQALILCPTRELAEQVSTEMRKLARAIPNIKVITITGGKSQFHQEKTLSHGAHIIVGTPGRVLKLIKRKTLKIQQVKNYVLDEADRMLDMGFSEDILEISSFVPEERQTLLFSATFPEDIEEMSGQLQTDAERISVDTTHEDRKIVEEFIELESHKDKMDALYRVLAQHQPERFIVFCKMKRITDEVADDLHDRGLEVESIHSDLEQSDRTEVLTMFSNKSLSGLVATDVAARGIDIKDLDLVVNFDIPNDPEVYVHRIGRTGRAGKDGRAATLFINKEDYLLEKIFEYQGKEHPSKGLSEFPEENEYKLQPSMRSLFIGGGKRDKLRPGDIVGAIVGESGVSFDEIGDISIQGLVSYVAIKAESSQLVCDKLNDGKIKNRKFKIGFV